MQLKQVSTSNPIDWVRTPKAAEYTGLSTSTLAKMRLRGDGPAYAKAGPRIVVYKIGDLDDWLAARIRQSTSDLKAGDQ